MNKITLMGRLTRDIETKKTKSGKEVGSFTLAVPRERNKEEVDFIDCVAFEKLSEIMTKYVKKGTKILIEGTLQINNYEDKEGNKRKATIVIANNFYFTEFTKTSEDKNDDMPF